MSDLLVQDTSLTAVADALRQAGGTDDPLSFPDDFVKTAQQLENVYTVAHSAGYEACRAAIINPEWKNWSHFCCGRASLVPLLRENDTANATTVERMFHSLGITEICNLNTQNVSNFVNMFGGCSKLIKAPLIDTSNGTNFNSMFYECNSLTEIPLLNLSRATVLTNMFYRCYLLTTLNVVGSIPVSIALSQSSILSKESVQTIINALADLTGKAAQTVSFHPTVGGNLTDEQKGAITAKNWTLAY